MELWIRSQSKEKLVKVENIYTSDELRDGRAIMGCNSSFINQDLGTYETKERALEVLDEIQELLKPNYIRTYEYKGYDEQPNTIVYEMPQE